MHRLTSLLKHVRTKPGGLLPFTICDSHKNTVRNTDGSAHNDAIRDANEGAIRKTNRHPDGCANATPDSAAGVCRGALLRQWQRP